jgi:alpha-L-fucosidase
MEKLTPRLGRYWWDLNQGPDTSDQTYEFHLQHYGTNFTYDDFIPQFSAEAFDPKEWVDLFSDAGAKYFVLTTKHHDGYALFDMDSTITKRNSVALSPHRNIVQELFDAASMYQPHLHRATYYSLPEWFNPDYLPYGFGRWPGGNATNPFTNVTLPYTGYVTHDDYVQDLVLPQMLTLASMGSELMWCDIGGPNMTAEFAASWFNNATVQGRQVTMNNRCGLPGDFDTPEYTTFAATQQRKWESNSGMDPYSYGFNRATPLNEYMNASTIITTLVDIISKNGNFLLDIGPMGNGTILDVEAQNLREAGSWINSHGEAIFNTTYWFVASEEGSDVRFTTKMDAFYVFVMNQVNDTLTLTSPIPWLEGDQVTVVGGRMNGTVVPSNTIILGNQTAVQFHISEEVRTADQWTWVFKITYDL